MAMYDIEGKLVAITGNREVGYATENKAIKGVVVSIDYEGDTDIYDIDLEGVKDSGTYRLNATTATALGLSADETYVVGVEWHKTKEGVSISTTASKKPVAGDFVLCDGSGGVVKVPADHTGYPTAYCENVDTTTNTATITIL